MRCHIVHHHAQHRHQRRHAQCPQRYTVFGQLHQRFGRIALFGQAEEHAAVAVHAAVVDRQRCGQHHKVEDLRCGVTADQREYLHKRAAAVSIAGCTQGHQQLIPRVQRQQHGQRANVENQHPVNHLVDGLGDDFFRFAGFGGSDAHQLQPAERKHDERHCHQQAGATVGKEAAVAPQIADRRLRAAGAAEQ